MKRFRELVAAARERFPDDDFFAGFESGCRLQPSRLKHYRPYNDALMLLDNEAWSTLREKALAHFRNERTGQRKQAFFNHLNEAFAYRHLQRSGFKNIRFIEEAKEKRPDLGFVDGGTECYCEVKTIGLSDNEIKRRETHGAQDGAVYVNLSPEFLNKLSATVETAWTQIRSLGEHGLVFIIVNPDDIAWDYRKRHRKQLTEFCRSQGFENLVIKMGYLGNRGIRINHRFSVGSRTAPKNL
jgi:hypothetical protein